MIRLSRRQRVCTKSGSPVLTVYRNYVVDKFLLRNYLMFSYTEGKLIAFIQRCCCIHIAVFLGERRWAGTLFPRALLTGCEALDSDSD